MNEDRQTRRSTRHIAEKERVENALKEGATLRQIIPLPYRKIIKKCFWSVLAVCVFWTIGSVFLLRSVGDITSPERFKQAWAAWIALLLVGLLWASGTQIIYFLRYFYDMDERSFTIRKGVIAQTEITLPFSKITDVYVDRDLFDVIFGLYDVHISSPTQTSGALAHIDGIDKRGAVLIRALVLDRIHKEDDAMATNPVGSKANA